MGRGIVAFLASVALLVATMRADTPAMAAEQTRAAAVTHIRDNFDTWLADPAAYRERALKECGSFPEGNIYPFLLPALGYTNLALRGDIPKEEAAKQVRSLIDLAIPEVATFVNAPGDDLLAMKDYGKQGTFLSTLNLALGNYALISDDGRYRELHDHVSRLLLAGLSETGEPVASYPYYTWYFDTAMTLASLHLWADKETRPQLTRYHAKHREWLKKNAMLPTGLPRAFPGDTSRGCDLSMQVCVIAHFDPALARELYAKYVATHWIDLGMVAGFAEWPPGHQAPPGGDIDSGPVVFGMGATATGVGIGTTKAAGDTARNHQLLAELGLASQLIRGTGQLDGLESAREWMKDNAPINPLYFSGFLYGDAALFYALTWAKYPPQHSLTTTEPNDSQAPRSASP